MNTNQYKSHLNPEELALVEDFEHMLDDTMARCSGDGTSEAASRIRRMRTDYLPHTVRAYAQLDKSLRDIPGEDGTTPRAEFARQLAKIRHAYERCVLFELPESFELEKNAVFLDKVFGRTEGEEKPTFRAIARPDIFSDDSGEDELRAILVKNKTRASTLSTQQPSSRNYRVDLATTPLPSDDEISKEIRKEFLNNTVCGEYFQLKGNGTGEYVGPIESTEDSCPRPYCHEELVNTGIILATITPVVIGIGEELTVLGIKAQHVQSFSSPASIMELIFSFLVSLVISLMASGVVSKWTSGKVEKVADLAWSIASNQERTKPGKTRTIEQKDLMSHRKFDSISERYSTMIQTSLMKAVSVTQARRKRTEEAGTFV